MKDDDRKVREVLTILDRKDCYYCESGTPPSMGCYEYSCVCDKHLIQAEENGVICGLDSLHKELSERGLSV